MIMADENGANKRTVGNVLGEDMRQRRVHKKYFTVLIKKIMKIS